MRAPTRASPARSRARGRARGCCSGPARTPGAGRTRSSRRIPIADRDVRSCTAPPRRPPRIGCRRSRPGRRSRTSPPRRWTRWDRGIPNPPSVRRTWPPLGARGGRNRKARAGPPGRTPRRGRRRRGTPRRRCPCRRGAIAPRGNVAVGWSRRHAEPPRAADRTFRAMRSREVPSMATSRGAILRLFSRIDRKKRTSLDPRRTHNEPRVARHPDALRPTEP